MQGKLSGEDIKRVTELLRKSGYKLTPQRQAIVDTIISSVGNHLTVEELYALVRLKKPEIGLATVYRTVILMNELGLVSRLDLKDGSARYEMTRIEENHTHHHLICTRCSRVSEFMGDLLEPIEHVIEEKYNFIIKDHSLKFYGICEECAKEEKLKEEKLV
ncbi:Fur family transcriptional regulator [Youngiibacter multivorans]|jgi:Fur family ferric uptake transcriptional regulator|nr:Fur family transcriptional regulator [Youngiibacter multivorans]MBP1920039.1 Fur family ferric uptake transcriptional regulator [Youngiibacter multivorans]MBW8383389.1 transcriptional repressor [Youngiibacter sp.]